MHHVVLRIVYKLGLQLLTQHNNRFIHKMIWNLVIFLNSVLLATAAAGAADLVLEELNQAVCYLALVVIARIVFEQVLKNALANIFDEATVLVIGIYKKGLPFLPANLREPFHGLYQAEVLLHEILFFFKRPGRRCDEVYEIYRIRLQRVRKNVMEQRLAGTGFLKAIVKQHEFVELILLIH